MKQKEGNCTNTRGDTLSRAFKRMLYLAGKASSPVVVPKFLFRLTQIENSWMYGKGNGTNLTPGCAAVATLILASQPNYKCVGYCYVIYYIQAINREGIC